MYMFGVKGFLQLIKLLEISIPVMIQPPMQCYKAFFFKFKYEISKQACNK